jgi:putative two-component system hydrogenase maturation factor HypX/HoxX
VAESLRLRRLADDPRLASRLDTKSRQRRADELIRPLASYRAEELGRMAENFFGVDRAYHHARHRFVHKIAAPRSPATAPMPFERTRRAA